VALECIKGRKNKEIASVLGIGAETVNKTLDHVYRAIGVNGRDQLVAKLLIADIDNTPLQQSLILTGDAAALVGVGFMESLYESRGERKRPRSIRSTLASKRNGNGSRQSQSLSLKRTESKTSISDLDNSEVLNAALNITADRAEDLAWHVNPEPMMESGALEG